MITAKHGRPGRSWTRGWAGACWRDRRAGLLDLLDCRVAGIVAYQRVGTVTRYRRNGALTDDKHMEKIVIRLTQYQVILIT